MVKPLQDQLSGKENDSDPSTEEQDLPSKSALKRQMSELQSLCDTISKLKPDEIMSFDLPESLQESLITAGRLKSSNARNRQLRHASKMLSSCDEALTNQLKDHFEDQHKQAQTNTRRHKLVETWRDKIMENPDEQINVLVQQFPEADRQEIRTLARLAVKEKSLGKKPEQQRKLFRYLRDNVVL